MARGINKVILIGNLGADPETRYGASGNAVTRLRLATSESWRDRTSGEQQERTEWHTVVCFSRLAEVAGEYLRKGSKVYIEGQLRTSSWEQDGQKRYRTEVHARDLQMLDGRGNGGGMGGGAMGGDTPSGFASQGGPSAAPAPSNAPTMSDDTDFEDDIPF